MHNQSSYFDRTTTNLIKGVALIMMFIHHFFTFPSWWGEGVSYPFLAQLAPYIQAPFRLCVAVFCFITGYFYYFNPQKTYRYSFKKISDLLISYWGVYLLLGLLAVFCVGYSYTPTAVLCEMFGMTLPTMNFCWYVYFYCLFMFLFPVVSRFLLKNKLLDCVICFLFLPWTITLAPYIPSGAAQQGIEFLSSFFPCVLSGYLFAAYGGFEAIEKKLSRCSARWNLGYMVLCFLAAVLACLCRRYEPTLGIRLNELPFLPLALHFDINLDVIYAPIFIYAVSSIHKQLHTGISDAVLCGIGKCSMMMWFTSCIFFNNSSTVFQPVLYFPKNPVLVLIWGLALCYGLSAVLDAGLKRIRDGKNKVLFP